VFVAAVVADMCDPLPTDWRGETFDVLHHVQRGALHVLGTHELPDWYHAHRERLPLQWVRDRDTAMYQPQTSADVGELAFLHAVLTQTLFQLVHVSPSDQPLRAV
jgi:hypothetical protein